MLSLLAAVVLAYLLGSLSGSLLLGRFAGVDIRQRGSGNAGGTNALRTLGWKFALGVVVIDIGKGALAAWLGLQLHDAAAPWPALWQGYACTLFAAVGHTWPVFHGFRGGKGAATLVGGLFVVWPAVTPVLLGVWMLVLTVTGYVGLATVCAGLALLPAAVFVHAGVRDATLLFAACAAAFLLFTHRGNLARLRRGTEHRFERARIWSRWFSRARPS